MFWHIYNYLAAAAIAVQILLIYFAYRNYRYVVRKAGRGQAAYRPRVLLTVPCKGIDKQFEKNISSFFGQDYDNYILSFVVESVDDPAYGRLCELREELCGSSSADEVKILVAGICDGRGQKIHNLLYSCDNCGEGVEVFAFADSDACVGSDWLSQLVYPLRKKDKGAATGYRWFVPEDNNLATLVLSSLNGKIAQLMGNSPFNLAWGGSMAIRSETFEETGLRDIWSTAISDDLCLSAAVRGCGKRIVFVPGCLVASYEKVSWGGLFEFGRRQFLITRITISRSWWFGLISCLYSLFGLWGGAVIAFISVFSGVKFGVFYFLVPLIFFSGQFFRSLLRQRMISYVLSEERARLKAAAMVDIFGNFLWSWVLLICILSSSLGRTICWRGVRYYIISPT